MNNRPIPVDGYVSYAIAAAHRTVSRSLAARLEKHGLRVEAWRVMEALDGGENLTMGALAETVLINPPTLSKLVDRMVSDGLVHRRLSRADQRQAHLLLTSIGRKRMIKVREDIRSQDTQIHQLLGEKNARDLISLLRSLS